MLADTFLRRSLFVALLATAGAFAVTAGCSAPAKQQQPLPVCDESDTECNGGSTTRRPSGSSGSSGSTGGPTGTPVPGDEPPPPSSTDAGSEASVDAAPKVEPSCVALTACCEQLKTAGYDPATCNGIVATNNNAACYNSLANYKNFGDCS